MLWQCSTNSYFIQFSENIFFTYLLAKLYTIWKFFNELKTRLIWGKKLGFRVWKNRPKTRVNGYEYIRVGHPNSTYALPSFSYNREQLPVTFTL